MASNQELTDFDSDMKSDDNVSAESVEGKTEYSSSIGTDFDFCDDFDGVERNISSGIMDNKSSPSSMSSDFDFCNELDDVLSLGTNFSVDGRSNSEFSGSDKEVSDDDVESNNSYVLRINRKGGEKIGIDNVCTQNGRLHFTIPGSRKINEQYPTLFKPKKEIGDVVKEQSLFFLPAKSLTRFKAVSKGWNQWISRPLLSHHQSCTFRDLSGYFQQRQDRSFISLCNPAYGVPSPSLSFLPEKVLIRSASNGLLLCQGEKSGIYYVCNPVTEKWKPIPCPEYYHGEIPAIALAFEPSALNISADYQIVCAVPVFGHPFIIFEIYSSQTGCWHCSDSLCMELEHGSIKSKGSYFNGIAYWKTSTNEILAFDIKNEFHGVFGYLPKRDGVFARVEGELCYVCVQNQNGNVFEVEIYGGMSMKLQHTVFFNVGECLGVEVCRVLDCVKDDVLVILVGSVMCFCCLKDEKVVIKCRGLDPCAEYFPYVNSLVSLA